MTWALNVVGHKANPEEENAVVEQARGWVKTMREDIDQDITTATFSGTYGFHDLLAEAEEPDE